MGKRIRKTRIIVKVRTARACRIRWLTMLERGNFRFTVRRFMRRMYDINKHQTLLMMNAPVNPKRPPVIAKMTFIPRFIQTRI